MNRRGAKREAQRVQSNREALIERMARALPEDGRLEALDGLFLGRVSKPMESVHALYQPAFSFIAQGGKRVLLGEEAGSVAKIILGREGSLGPSLYAAT